MIRPAASQAASPEPMAIETEKIARQVVTTSSLPPSTFFTSGGISESATAPTSQNQLVTSAPHNMSENTIMRNAKWAGPPCVAAIPPTMVPSRMAMKVAPSTSALPLGSSERARWSGRMPYLIGPNSEAITPNRNSATNSNDTEDNPKPVTAMKAMPISANLSHRATTALS